MINVLSAPHEKPAPIFAKAFAQGCGGQVVTHYTGGPWAGFGSPETWPGLMQARRAREDFYYGDHAYFGRGRFYRITKNAFQHRGVGGADFERLAMFHGRAMPLNQGARIIVCPQSEGHHARFMASAWLADTLAKLETVTDREIVIRTKATRKPIEADLDDAWCVITHSSACAIHALMAGVPAICTADCAASRLSGSDPFNVEYPFLPSADERDEWAAVLAANQWTLEEIAQGQAWRILNEAV